MLMLILWDCRHRRSAGSAVLWVCVFVDVCLPVCLCMLPLCCTKLHLILRFLLCVCVCKLVVYVTFSASCYVVAAFWAVHGLHLNKPVAAYVGVCTCVEVLVCACLKFMCKNNALTDTHTYAFPACHTRQTTQKFCIFRAALKEKKRNKNI